MRILLLILFPVMLFGQDQIIFPSYIDDTGSPIYIDEGSTVQFQLPGYFINELRYEFYRELHEFALENDFMGHEREILDEFAGFLDDHKEIVSEMDANLYDMRAPSEALKTAQESVSRLNEQLYNLQVINAQLNEQLQKARRVKKRWQAPVTTGLVAAAIGLTTGVLLMK